MTSSGTLVQQEGRDLASQLYQAALSGDKGRVRGLLLHQQGGNFVDEETKRLCLYLAVSSGDRALATRVLEMGYDVRRGLTRQGDTALHLACRSPVPDLLVIRRLVREGRSAVNVQNHARETALHVAAGKGHVEAAAILLSSGAGVSVQNRSGDTPLHCAVRGEHTRAVCLLLVHGALTDCENHRSELPILLAAKLRQTHILRVLLNQTVLPEERVRKALTKCLRSAVLKGDSDLACVLLQKGAYVNGLVKGRETVLHLAASRGDTSLVNVLVRAGADVNALSDDVTALHCASQRGHSDVVDILLTNGAVVNTAINDSSLALTAMHLATTGRHWRVLEQLCDYGGDVNLVDGAGNTPLHSAATNCSPTKQLSDVFGQRTDRIMDVLLRVGADPAVRNKARDMPHHLAAHGGHVLQLHQLLAAGSPLHALDGYNETALSAVMTQKRTDLVLLLLAHGAKPGVLSHDNTNELLLDTVDRALLVHDAILNSGNLTQIELRKYQTRVWATLGKTEKAFRSMTAASNGQQVTLKTITRLFLRNYLLQKCRVGTLWNTICSLRLPKLLQRYLLLQDYVESLKQYEECADNSQSIIN